MRKKASKQKIDSTLLVTILLLSFIGLLMVASSSWPESVKNGAGGYSFTLRHLVFLLMGLVACGLTTVFPLKWIRKLSFLFWAVSFILCLLLWTPLGVNVSGSTRWLQIPYIGFRFMPSDLLKFSSVIFFANLLDIYRGRGEKKGFIPLMIIFASSVLIVIVRDFSSAMVIGLTLGLMFLLAGMRFLEILFNLVGGGIGVRLMIYLFPYRIERLQSFRDPFDDIADTDWQLANSLYAFAMGGIRGVGYFNSRQKYSYVPEAYNDFIFAILGEEFGLLGTLFVVALFLVFIWRGMAIALSKKQVFDKLLAFGITLAISIQALFNMGVSVGGLPVTGITLPFISYGGTSLILNLVLAGILLNLSKSEVEA
ncbi:MAG: putative peptidoglycan glycosyltransferase FtsW [Tissierellia bacterium]|nr:putative peptidoglycan glycosyltransferase FtsW [Tissierellia bacterium]